ncbi:ribonuclease BN [Kitasatospora paranensis]|uniref:Ribonuclease BN n=1 Tax=Kitasatospora paranensis TaxID=258053 RepID=A0ABW2FRK7_9ACTN
MADEDRTREHPGPGAAPARRGRAVSVAREVWRQARTVELLQRCMAFAALSFVTLVPLLIVIAAASATRGSGITGWFADGLGLTERGSRATRDLFTSRGQVLSTTTGIGIAALAVFGVSLMASIQTVYERIWHLDRGPWHAAWRQALGLAGLTGYILVAAWSGHPWQHSAAQPALRLTATLLGGILLFWWLQRLLLGSRVAWRRLLPGAVATMAGLAGLRFFSRLVFAPLLVSNAVSYGAVGTVLVLQTWLVGVGYTIYGGAIAGQALAAAKEPDPSDPRRGR